MASLDNGCVVIVVSQCVIIIAFLCGNYLWHSLIYSDDILKL